MNQTTLLPLVSAALAAAGFLTPAAHGQIQTAGTVFVNVDATSLPYGAAATITNSGSLGGVFQGFGNSVIADSPGGASRGIQFDGTAYMQLLTNAGGVKIPPPAGLVGLSPTRSIEVWAFNPSVADEETLVSWGKRGGPDGSNMSFNYGVNAQFGAIGHWGGAGPDIGWNDSGGSPAAGQWHHLAYTFDGTVTRVYADGAQANTETLAAGLVNTHTNTSILLAAQLETDGVTVTPTLRGTLFIAKVRIHDGVLTAGQILNNYNTEKLSFAGPVRLAASPVSQLAVEGGLVTFAGQASGDPPISFQWFRGNAPIANATANSYTIDEVSLGDNGALFSLQATNVVNGTGARSTNATLTVVADTVAPVLVAASAGSQSSLTVLDGVSVAFSEKVSPVTANDAGNYVLTGPQGAVPISGAGLNAGGRSVFLLTGVLTQGASYTLTVSGIRDRAVAGNLITAGSQATFVAAQFAVTNIGTVSAGGAATAVPGGYDLSARGRDIGGTADEFAFHARVYVGDFDLQTRLESLELSDGYSEAGLMARPAGAANALFAATLASPSLGGMKFQSRATIGAAAIGSGGLPVNYPYTWLRLQRVGNLFTGLGSLDGFHWQRLGSATLAMPANVLVGFAVTSHQTNTTVLARLREASVGNGGTIASSLLLPFEPLGPSTRRTGLVISEIMYHPAEVAGLTNSLEYIELFNGQDYFEDLTGFRIDGDIHYDFPPGTLLLSGGFLVIARNPSAVQSHYNLSGVLGPWRITTNVTATATNVGPESLPNSRGTVRLENELGAHLLEVNYDSDGDWPVAADGAGHSLVLARPSYGERNAQAWAASEFIGGSPGRRESYLDEPQRAVRLNEILAHTDLPAVDAVELFNAGATPVDLGGCWLSDDFGTNKFRIADGTLLAPRSFIAFTETQLGFNLSSDGEEILLVHSNRTRVLDAVRFGGQANGVSRGRVPDGSPYFRELAAPTLGTNNSPALRRDVVINEIMYHPISGRDADEFVELYNRGAGTVDVGQWRLMGGISFTIPAHTLLPSGGYLVVAKDRTNLLARYPQLAATPDRVVGDYGGQLADSGERVALAMPEVNIRTNTSGIPITNIFYIVVNEVNYRDGGRWGTWSDGGGSSLELIDPRADNQLAANWADSDETQKASWTLVERTGILDLGMVSATSNPDRLESFIEGPGECLLDDVEVRFNGGPNRVTNPGFESGDASWAFQGTHRRSVAEPNGGHSGSGCLHLKATERGDAGPNRIRTAVALLTPTGGTNMATLRAWVRWLRGDTNILLRIRGQWLECAGSMTVPTNLGTPGAPNSRRIPNAGPALYSVAHAPVLPAANEPVVVTARVNDPDGLSAFTLRYRIDPGTSLSEAPMRDDGSGGDAVAGDGIYSATIPGQGAGSVLAFHLRAADGQGVPATTLFPEDAPMRECLVRFGETVRPGAIVTYRLWLIQSNLTFWTQRERNANDGLDCTFVYGYWRAVYNAKTLYSGSPWHTANQPYTGPLGNTCDYEVEFPSDDPLLGQQDFVLNTQAPVTTFFDNDTSAQAESTAYWLGRKLGLGFNHKRHVFVTLNGQDRGMVFFDHQQPNQDIIQEYFPNDADGHLHKIEDWFEFDDAGSGFNIITCTLQNFLVGGQKRTERYRWTWRPRARSAPNDFADLFAAVDAGNASGPDLLTRAVNDLVDVPQWMRHFALQHAVGNWDTYGYERGKNCFAYKPTQGPWRLLLWDLDLVLGKQSRTTTDPIFNTAGSEPVIATWYNHPPFVREFWNAMADLVNGPMLPANYNPLVNARFEAFRANDVPVDTPEAMKQWIDGRRTFILSQMPMANFGVLTTNFQSISSNSVTLSGTAPVTAGAILVNGGAYPVTWTSPTAWTLRVPLAAGSNALVISAVTRAGTELDRRTNIVVYTGPVPAPEGSVVLNEILYNPLAEGTSFVELFNTQSNFVFDLSQWRVNGLDYTFPPGSVIAPRSFLVLGRNRGEYAKGFGALTPFFDEFPGSLQNGGETLSLLRPGGMPGAEIEVDKVKYEARAPWPAGAAHDGASLQLIDAAQDNARVSNWTDGQGWRLYSFTGLLGGTRLLIYIEGSGNLFLDEISIVPGTTPAAGTNLLANGGFETPLAPFWKLNGTNGTNSASSPAARFLGNQGLDLRFVPGGSTVQYLYQDLTNVTTNVVTTVPHTLSFWYLPSTTVTGSLQFRISSNFRAAVNVRAATGTQVASTPATTNVSTVPLPPYPLVWLNEVLPINTTGLTDHLGEREPWLELFNSSLGPVSLAGLYLSDDYSNLTKWAFPSNALIQPGEFKVVFADGEPGESTVDEWHTNFRLTNGTGSIALSRVAIGSGQVMDYLNFDELGANRSYGAFPDGQLFNRQEFYNVTPGGTNNGASAPLVVYINEWMAANTGLLLDPADNPPAADDWFELYNPGAAPVDLGGAFLTDDLAVPFLYRIPDNGHYTIPPHGYLLVWADNQPAQNSTNLTDLHAGFALRQIGESIALFAANGAPIDSITFGPQTENVSEGRFPDGTGAVVAMTSPTPRAANILGAMAPQISGVAVLPGNLFQFSFTTEPGRSYRVYYKNELNEPAWLPLGPAQPGTGGALTVMEEIGVNARRFYQVFVE